MNKRKIDQLNNDKDNNKVGLLEGAQPLLDNDLGGLEGAVPLQLEGAQPLHLACLSGNSDQFTPLINAIKKKLSSNNPMNPNYGGYYKLLNDCFLIALSTDNMTIANIIMSEFYNSGYNANLYTLYEFYNTKSLECIKNAIKNNKCYIAVKYLQKLTHDELILNEFTDFLIEYMIDSVNIAIMVHFFRKSDGSLYQIIPNRDLNVANKIIRFLIFQIFYKNKKESFKLLDHIDHRDYIEDKIKGAVKGLHLDLIQDLIDKDKLIETMECPYCQKQCYKVDYKILVCCAKDNRTLPIIKYLATKTCFHDKTLFFIYALVYSQYEIIDWIIDEKIDFRCNLLDSNVHQFHNNKRYNFDEYFDIKNMNLYTDYIFMTIKFDINTLVNPIEPRNYGDMPSADTQLQGLIYLLETKKLEVNFRHAIYIVTQNENYNSYYYHYIDHDNYIFEPQLYQKMNMNQVHN